MSGKALLACASCLLGAVWGLVGASRPASAQEAAEIVVTAPSAGDAIALRDAPGNVAVLKGDVLRGQGNLADLLNASVGSVTVSNGNGNPYQNDVSYRGFQATSLLGAPTGLSVYVDGVRMNEPFGGGVNWDLIPMNAVASVQVLPGSNPVFGLNTLGGALVVGTKNGADNGGLALSAQGGTSNRRAVQGEAGGRLAGGFDWFAAGNYDVQDGYRLFTHSDVAQAYGKLRWRGARAHAELGVSWADSDLHGTQGLPLSMLAMPAQAYTAPDDVANRQLIVNLKGDAQVAEALHISGNVYYRHAASHVANSNASLDDACGDQVDCAGAAPGGTALNLDAGGDGLRIADYTSHINTSLAFSDVRQNIFGGNWLLDVDQALGGLRNDLNIGGSFEVARVTFDQSTYLARLIAYQTVLQPWNMRYGSAGGFQGNPLIGSINVATHDASYNLFARDVLHLTKALSLTVSLSYTATHVSLSGTNAAYLGADGGAAWVGGDGQAYYNPAYLGAQYWAGTQLATFAAPMGGVAGPEVDPVAGAHDYHRWNPSLGVTWNPSRALGFFADASEAMRAPTAIELACADPQRPCALPTGFVGDPDLAPVVAHTLELGARGVVGRVSWNVAAYRTVLDHDIEFIFTPAGLGYFANVGQTQRRGLEAGVSADFNHWHLSASYGYVAATYRAGFTDANGDTVVPGDHLAGIPGQSVKLHAGFTPSKEAEFGASLIATSGQWAHGDEANLNTEVPGYMLVNVDARLHPMPRVEVFGSVNNLLDRRYATFGVMGQNIYTAQPEQFRTPAPGRSVMVGLRYGFGKKAASAADD